MESQRLLCDRVLDGQFCTVQCDACGEWSAAAVAGIAENRAAGCGQLHANLMLATGLELNFEQCGVVVLVELAVAEECLAGSGGTGAVDFHASCCFIVSQPVFKVACWGVWGG